MKESLFISLMMLLSSASFAQFKVSGELRTRGEYRNGYKNIPTSSTDALTMVGQRTRLNVFYQKDKPIANSQLGPWQKRESGGYHSSV